LEVIKYLKINNSFPAVQRRNILVQSSRIRDPVSTN
jgi:hypothetical protein